MKIGQFDWNIRKTIFLATGLNVQNAAAHWDILNALTNLTQLLPAIVVDLGEHFHKKFAQSLSLSQCHRPGRTQPGCGNFQAVCLDTPSTHVIPLSILLDEHLHSTVNELHSVTLVHGQDITRQCTSIVYSLRWSAFSIANHESVSWEPLRQLIEVVNRHKLLVVGVQVLVGLLFGDVLLRRLRRGCRRGGSVITRGVDMLSFHRGSRMVNRTVTNQHVTAVLQLGSLGGERVFQVFRVALRRSWRRNGVKCC